jgi:putative transposase
VKLELRPTRKATDKAFIESFNGRLRQECLNQYWFTSLEDARKTVEAWRQEYSAARSRTSLGNKTPIEYAAERMQIRSTPKVEFLPPDLVQ